MKGSGKVQEGRQLPDKGNNKQGFECNEIEENA